MTMIERIARAMQGFSDASADWKDYINLALITVETMREPTFDIVKAGVIYDPQKMRTDTGATWSNMIDAILTEKLHVDYKG
jgi:hypothetical protein